MDYEKIKQHLESLCFTITPTDSFYRACVDGGLIERTTLYKIKEYIKLQGHGVATFLLSLTPLGGVAITKLVEIIEKTGNNVNQAQLYTAREHLSEAWERYHQQIIGILITIREREGNAIENQKISILTQKAREEVRVELAEINKSREKLESEKKSLMGECNRLKSEVLHLKTNLAECNKKLQSQSKTELVNHDNTNNELLSEASEKSQGQKKEHKDDMHPYANSQKEATGNSTAKYKFSDQNIQTDILMHQLNNLTLHTRDDNDDDDVFISRKGLPALSERPQSTKSDPGRSSSMHRSLSLPSKLVSLPEQGPFVHLKNIGGRSRTKTHPASGTSLPPIAQGFQEKTDQSVTVSPQTGAFIALDDKSSISIQRGAVKTKTQVTAKMCKDNMQLQQKLVKGDLSDEICLGNCYNINSQPDVNFACSVRTKPPGQFNSLFVHQSTVHKRKAQSFQLGIQSPNKKFAAALPDDNITDITDQLNYTQDDNGVTYQINGSGQYQEFWVILKEKEDDLKKQKEIIKRLQKRLANLRKLDICMCDITLFIPQTIPNNYLCLIFTNQEVQRNCSLYIQYNTNPSFINTAYQPSSAYVHHQDEITIKNPTTEAPLHVLKVNMLELRGKGMEVKVGLGNSTIPSMLQVVNTTHNPVQYNRRRVLCNIPTLLAAEIEQGMPYQDRLRSNWCDIIENLEDSGVIDYLYQEHVLSSRQMNEVKDKSVRQERNGKLLGILMTAGERGYHKFCDALRQSEGSAWLEERLNNT